MGQIAISVTMRTAFRNATQEFSNTFHYGSTNPNPNAADAENLLDEVVAAMRLFHSTTVSFVHGRVWSSGGGAPANEMIFEKALTGTGATTVHANLDRERAILVQWSAGKDIRGKVVYLRKWFHPCGGFGEIGYGPAILENTTGFDQVTRDAIAAHADTLTRIGNVEQWGLVAESGRERDGGPPIAHPFLEHHQFGDQWRG